MDIKRKDASRKKLVRRIAIITVAILVIAGVTFGLNRLKPAAPTVERATVWIDQVKRGPMIRQVRGLGTLVAEDILVVPAQFDGRVEKRNVLAGVPVQQNTVLMVLSNPDMELAANDLEWQVKQAQANFQDLKVKLESQRLDQKTLVAKTKSDFQQSKLTLDRDRELFRLNLKADLEVKLSEAKTEELKGRLENEDQRLAILGQSIEAQTDSQKVQIEKLQAAFHLKRQQVEQLVIRAGVSGMLQEIPVQVGQRVTPGMILARVSQPTHLKAELKIPETQARDISLNQDAQIDTRNGIIAGKVSRIDPAAVGGTVTIDVRLLGELPLGARPDLSVDGTIEIERLADVVYVGRPVFGQPNSQITLFRLEVDNKTADRIPVKLGRTSVNTIEIVDGLKVGDQVILSDMSAWDAQNRIRLN